jgi:hypothetical protein
MGKFTLTIIAPKTEASPTANPTASPTANPTASPTANPTTSPTATPTANPTASPEKNNTDALKILTFILYYVYYHTFEDPLNNHFFERLTDVQSEKSSQSFYITLMNMLKNNNTDGDGDGDGDGINDSQDAASNKHSMIIDMLSKSISNNLEKDLFKDLKATTLIRSANNAKVLLRNADKKIQLENKNHINKLKSIKESNIMYNNQNLIFENFIQEEKDLYIILALKMVNDTINTSNNHLMLIEKLKELNINNNIDNDSESPKRSIFGRLSNATRSLYPKSI